MSELDDFMKRLGAPKELLGDAPARSDHTDSGSDTRATATPTPAPAQIPAGPPGESPAAGFLRGFTAPRAPTPPPEANAPGGWAQTLDPTPIARGAVGGIENIAEMIPGYQSNFPGLAGAARGFAAERPDEKWGAAKRFAGEALPWLAVGSKTGIARGIEGAAAKLFPDMVPATLANLSKIPGMVTKAGNLSKKGKAAQAAGQVANPSRFANTMRGAATTAGRIAEPAAMGAVQGAADAPDDRLRGALFGAAGGGLAPSLGSLARSRFAANVAGHSLKHGAGAAAAGWGYHFLGPAGLLAYPAVAKSPIGAGIDRMGHYIFDRSGKLTGFIPERMARAIDAAMGGAAGRIMDPHPGMRSEVDQMIEQEMRNDQQTQISQNPPLQTPAQPRRGSGRPADDSDSETED